MASVVILTCWYLDWYQRIVGVFPIHTMWLVRGECVGDAALGGEPVEFLKFRNHNVLEQKSRDVVIG